MNAMSTGLRAALADALDELNADPEVRALILTGARRLGRSPPELDLEGVGVPDPQGHARR